MKTNKSFIELGLLLLSAFILVYFTPRVFGQLLFPIYCLFFFNSKKNALWIVFLFILIEAPGGLFGVGSRAERMVLPIYTLAAGISLSFEQLFLATALLKAFKTKNKFKPISVISSNLKTLAGYFVFIVFLSVLLGISFNEYRLLFKIIVNLTLFYSFYFLFKDESEFIDFFELIFPLVFLAFALQIYSIISGHQLITLFKPEVLFTQGLISGSESRPIEMATILNITFFGSLHFLLLNKKQFKQTFLVIVNVISFTSIFLTSTRTWVIAFVIAYLLLFILLTGRMSKIVLKNSTVLAAGIFFLLSSSFFQNPFSQAYKRISTVELMVKGDMTAGRTLDRFDIQGPKVMRAFAKSTILFGAGFTALYFSEGTGHVGYQNFLLNGGIIGIILITLFFVKIFKLCFKLKLSLGKKNPYKDSMIIFLVWLLAILIINVSSQMIGYDISLNRILLLCVFIYFFNNQVKAGLNYPSARLN